MVNYSEDALSETFAALADPTRRAILARLSEGDTATVGDLAAPFAMSLPAVSKHLKVLEHANLIRRHRDGRVHRCGLNPEPMIDAAAWITHYQRFWTDRLEALARYLETDSTSKPDKGDPNAKDGNDTGYP